MVKIRKKIKFDKKYLFIILVSCLILLLISSLVFLHYRKKGNYNSCGQFALYLVINNSVDYGEVYRETNPLGIFTSPYTIKNYLLKKGIPTSIVNNADIDEIKRNLDLGKKIIVMINAGGGVHWISIFGFNKTGIYFFDSYYYLSQKNLDEPAYFSFEEFGEKWKDPFITFNNFMIIVGENGGDKFGFLTGVILYLGNIINQIAIWLSWIT